MIIPTSSNYGSDTAFDPRHPRHRQQVQRIARRPSQVMIVHFQALLSLFQAEEDAVRRGHPRTIARRNDLCEVLLGFFVPWEQLPSLFLAFNEPKRDAYSTVFSA